ncbi:MAG: AAA family ATPase [Candidatus Moranbacteria bacterium]|nr:AAA family ATPase [Candidatus Moranbacteria bacterium]
MYLKKLEIAGFKSFANKTTLEFLPAGESKDGENRGITAIVGPNGSGKSNVADAIRWVMGEQSMKNLRGKKAEDIIFAGSKTKARLGHAAVSLHFDNSDKRIPIEFAEVVITRKIFRNGESEYRINGSKTRLLDIVDILAKAGIGRGSYCVITQGMTDAVLNATPMERKSIIEDAAGVKQFQIQKIRALKKLESTRENLEKVRSLACEIEPHLNSLQRQAEKAQKGKAVKEELLESQKKLFAYLWHSFKSERTSFYEDKEQLGRDMKNTQREVDKLNEEIKKESGSLSENKEIDKLKKDRDDVNYKINELERKQAISYGKIEILEERRAQLDIVKSVPVDKKYIQSGIDKLYGSHKELISRLKKVKTLEELEEIQEFATSIGQDLRDFGIEIEKGKVTAQKTPEQIEKQKEVEKEIIQAEKMKEKISHEISDLKKKTESITKEIEDQVEKDRKARQHFFDLEKEVRSKQYELDRIKDKFNESKIRLARVEVREEDLVNDAKNEIRVDVRKLEYDGKPVHRDELERKIARLKIQMEQIGGIDPMVLEEYQETNERFNFLIKESEDLEQAIKALKEVAKEMDQEIEKVFSKAFVEINKEFSKYFQIVFGGGKASLVKTKIQVSNSKKRVQDEEGNDSSEIEEQEDEKNMKTEIGIDIFACPPKKKISNLSMLSGGERSLTSIALLFAIISYNPPPFAVLDEVEAALDEANSRRFGRILQELSDNTQFVAITHNRETMRQASLLYGVTMGDDGISKLLSVKLDQVGQGGKIKE